MTRFFGTPSIFTRRMPHCDLSMRLGLLQNNLIKNLSQFSCFWKTQEPRLYSEAFARLCSGALRFPVLQLPLSPLLWGHMCWGDASEYPPDPSRLGENSGAPPASPTRAQPYATVTTLLQAPGDLPILQSSPENKKISVNCKALTNPHLLALARPQASLLPLEENPSLPQSANPSGGPAWGGHKIVVPKVALLFQVYRAFCWRSRPHLIFASCLLPHLLSLVAIGEKQLSCLLLCSKFQGS